MGQSIAVFAGACFTVALAFFMGFVLCVVTLARLYGRPMGKVWKDGACIEKDGVVYELKERYRIE